MANEKRIYIRCPEKLKTKIQLVARERNTNVSSLIINYIKRLPNPTAGMVDNAGNDAEPVIPSEEKSEPISHARKDSVKRDTFSQHDSDLFG